MATTTPAHIWPTGGTPSVGGTPSAGATPPAGGTPLAGGTSSADADIWCLVTSYGQADWPEDELDRRARDLATIHRADRNGLRWNLRWGVVPWLVLEHPVCVFCGRDWLCPPAAWAHARLSTLGSFRREHLCEEVP
ncbi:hypothetical protein [Actinopolymorpha alba]|uniref:hypothetical protein n=1 Tax=Actinopolymorpha alba TaxID=533267 RepID=UPI00037B0F24|nr:hypothetical protein [Actinopolymorpha alba]